MVKPNQDLRIEILKSGLTYRQIAKAMEITPVWLSRAMARKLTPDMRRRIDVAVDELTASRHARRRS